MKLLVKISKVIRIILRIIYYSKVRSLFPRKTLRYIDWFIIRDNVKIYNGKSLKYAINEVLLLPPPISCVEEKDKQKTIKDITTVS